MGLLFSVVTANFFLGCLGVILRFSTEWCVQPRPSRTHRTKTPPIGHRLHHTSTSPPKQTRT